MVYNGIYDEQLLSGTCGEVQRAATFECKGLAVPLGLYDARIFGKNRDDEYHAGNKRAMIEDVVIVDKYGVCDSDKYGHIHLANNVVDPAGYDALAKKLHLTATEIKQLAHYQMGVYLDPRSFSMIKDEIGIMPEKYSIRQYSDIMSGTTALMYMLQDENSHKLFKFFINDIYVCPARFRRCDIIKTPFGEEVFEYNNLNQLYRQIIHLDNNISSLLNAPMHPQRLLWEMRGKLQNAVDMLSEEWLSVHSDNN